MLACVDSESRCIMLHGLSREADTLAEVKPYIADVSVVGAPNLSMGGKMATSSPPPYSLVSATNRGSVAGTTNTVRSEVCRFTHQTVMPLLSSKKYLFSIVRSVRE